MKNLKKVAAFGLAAAMSVSMGVSAFAAVSATSDNANFASYENGVAKLNNTGLITADNQWTVVIIDKSKANDNLSADDLYYINQGTNADDFWFTNGMGTKVDLTTLVNETTTSKDFVIRIGGDSASIAESGVVEIPFTLTLDAGTGRTSIEFLCGDANCDGVVDLSDVTNLISAYLGGNKSFTSSIGDVLVYDSSDFVDAEGVAYTFSNGYAWGDINGDGAVDLSDVTNLISAYLGGVKTFNGEKYGKDYTYDSSMITMPITKK